MSNMMKIAGLFLATFLFSEVLTKPQSGPPSDGDEECRPHPPNPHNRVICCADAPGLFAARGSNSTVDQIISKCRDEAKNSQANQAQETGPGGRGPPPDIECMMECVYQNMGLLDSKNKLDQAAVTTLLGQQFTGDWAAIGTKAVESCFSSSSSGSNFRQSNCVSGAKEFDNCLARITFLNCPSSKWNSDETCTTLKATVEKCPQYHVHF